MNKSILKPIFGGVFFGTILFFAGPLILIVLLLKFIFTPFGMGRMMMYRGMGAYGAWNPFELADKIRNMSEEEYSLFQIKMKDRFQSSCCKCC